MLNPIGLLIHTGISTRNKETNLKNQDRDEKSFAFLEETIPEKSDEKSAEEVAQDHANGYVESSRLYEVIQCAESVYAECCDESYRSNVGGNCVIQSDELCARLQI